MPAPGPRPVGGYKVVCEYANRLAATHHTVHIVYAAAACPERLTWRGRLRAAARYLYYRLTGRYSVKGWFPLHEGVREHFVRTLAPHRLPRTTCYVATAIQTARALRAYRAPGIRKFYLLQHVENWDFSDAEEAAIYDMRLGMEKSFMFGVKNTIFDPRKKENVMLTGGIWWQAGNHYTYNPSVEMTQNDLIDMMRQAFTGNGGNKRKILIGGSSFIGRINKIEMTKVVMAREDKVQWGIDFSEIRSKFGKLYVLYSEVFDDCGMSDYGFIFDPEFIQKWSHVPFDTQELDLKKSGVRNTDALVLTEASCLTLRYPAAHMRIEPVVPDGD